MGIFFRVNFLLLAFAFAIFSCSPAEPTAFPVTTPASESPSEIPAKTDIPKQSDLIFIEFFAGT